MGCEADMCAGYYTGAAEGFLAYIPPLFYRPGNGSLYLVQDLCRY